MSKRVVAGGAQERDMQEKKRKYTEEMEEEEEEEMEGYEAEKRLWAEMREREPMESEMKQDHFFDSYHRWSGHVSESYYTERYSPDNYIGRRSPSPGDFPDRRNYIGRYSPYSDNYAVYVHEEHPPSPYSQNFIGRHSPDIGRWSPCQFQTQSDLSSGPIVGLRNLGMTCFLNTVLQSLASCSFFVEWSVSLPCKGNVTQTIERILRILNGEVNGVDIPYSPTDILAAIRKHGWAMPHSEHDAHEFFHVVLTSIEEEITKNSPLRKSLLDIQEKESEETNDEEETEDPKEAAQDQGDVSSEPMNQKTATLDNKTVLQNGNAVPIRNFACFNKMSPNIMEKTKSKPSPFKGFLTSQLKCTDCGFMSPLRYDPFDSISLHLPPSASILTHYSLTQLLDKFVETEQVEGVECDSCNKNRDKATPPVTATAEKTLRFGKLPKCLCFHIARMIMQSNGTTFKRQDSVEFSEYLIMDPYTHNTLIKQTINNNRVRSSEEGSARIEEIDKPRNHLYRLKAVIVHKGNGESGGHFITYRHGYLRSQTRHRCKDTRNNPRWYYTSDEEVRQTTLCEVLSSLPYMMFYEKCEVSNSDDSADR